MAKTKLITEFAEQAGKSFDDAKTAVDDLGEGTARDLLNKSEDSLSWKVPATATAGGGTALGWRQQNVWTAEANANESESEGDTIADIFASDDLSAEQKQSLAQQALNQSGQNPPGEGGLLKDLFGGLDVQKLVLMIVALLVIVAFAQSYAGQMGQSFGDL